MFGKNYANHLDILIHSFGEMNENYKTKTGKTKESKLLKTFKQVYVSTFGIPEIGFQIRSLYFENIVSSKIKDKQLRNILDAGSGIGAYSFWLAKKYKNSNVLGGEIDKNKLKFCNIFKKEDNIHNLNFAYLDITKRQKKSTYDLIVSIDVLEHVNNYIYVLKNFHNLLHKGGYLYIHVPQPNQKRLFSSLRTWHHDDHMREGITKKELEKILKQLGFRMLEARETFGFFGKLAWELNHIMLSKNFLFAGITFPFLYFIAKQDLKMHSTNGLGVALLVQKK